MHNLGSGSGLKGGIFNPDAGPTSNTVVVTLSGAFLSRNGRIYSGRWTRDSSPSPTRRYSTLHTVATQHNYSSWRVSSYQHVGNNEQDFVLDGLMIN